MTKKQIKQILIKVKNGGFITSAIWEIEDLLKAERNDLIEKIEKTENPYTYGRYQEVHNLARITFINLIKK